MRTFENHRPGAAWTAWHILSNTYNAMTVSYDVAAANVNGIAITITHNVGTGLDVHAIHANGDTYGYDPQGDDAQAIAIDAIGFINRHAYPDTAAAQTACAYCEGTGNDDSVYGCAACDGTGNAPNADTTRATLRA